MHLPRKASPNTKTGTETWMWQMTAGRISWCVGLEKDQAVQKRFTSVVGLLERTSLLFKMPQQLHNRLTYHPSKRSFKNWFPRMCKTYLIEERAKEKNRLQKKKRKTVRLQDRDFRRNWELQNWKPMATHGWVICRLIPPFYLLTIIIIYHSAPL